MSKTFAAIFGALTGLIVTPVTLYFVASESPSLMAQLIIGAGVGGFFGAVMGSLGGDLSRQADAQGGRASVGFLAGAIAGVIATMNYDAILGTITSTLSLIS